MRIQVVALTLGLGVSGGAAAGCQGDIGPESAPPSIDEPFDAGTEADAGDLGSVDVGTSDTGTVDAGTVGATVCPPEGGRIFERPTPLPPFYETYCFPEPEDQVVCSGATNPTATLERVLFGQTHLFDPDWPLFFLIAERPALVQVLVTGAGASPEVSITGWIDTDSTSVGGSEPLGTLCMAGPAELPAVIDPNDPDSDQRFAVTLPSSWLRPGLQLRVQAGGAQRSFSSEQLGLQHSTDVNIAMINVDVANYNDEAEDDPIPATFLGDLASALPGRKVRFGEFPARMKLPVIPVSTTEGILMLDRRLCRGNEEPLFDNCLADENVGAGLVNGSALRFISALHGATGDFAYTIYFGNTQRLNPGGWGGGRSFVSIQYAGVTLHEGGHALSLPHWSNDFGEGVHPDQPFRRSYPYGGETDNGGGRGPTWNYHQNVGQFSSPICSVPEHQHFGVERSDAMQRARNCPEMRGGVQGPWDGFSDYSSVSMFRYLNGAARAEIGQLEYRGGTVDYQLRGDTGFPTLELDETGTPTLTQYVGNEPEPYERSPWMMPEVWEAPVYAVLGTYHVDYPEVNHLQPPMRYTGTLPHVIDPTDPETFAHLLDESDGVYDGEFRSPRDLVIKLVYADGSASHALYARASTQRTPAPGQTGIWRRDLLYWALVVPDRGELARIEMYRRPFVVRGASDTMEGNIANPSFNITAANFMDDATLLSTVTP